MTLPPPVTEVVLRRLGRPRWLWTSLWALIAMISPLVFGTAIRSSGHAFATQDFIDLFAAQAAIAYACFVLLWGSGLLYARAIAVRNELAQLAPHAAPADLFRGIGSVRGPLLLTGTVAAIVTANGWARYGPVPPLAALPFLFAYLGPILTFVWVYVAILIDLDRLGRRPLALDTFPEDRTLGLERLGSLASTGLGLVLLAAVPVLFGGGDDAVTLGISLAIVALTFAAFVLSMWRVHRQMTDAKARYVAVARRLYRDAYAPIREDANIERLASHASVLSAAQSLDERANTILTWPIGEGTLRFLAIVLTGVVTGLIVRGLLAAFGA